VALGENVPDNIRDLILTIGIAIPVSMSIEERKIYDAMLEGGCATCTKPVGKGTLIVIGRQGIGGMFCSGKCMADMHVMGWLQETHEDVRQAIEFRGGAGDEPEEEESED
jgi:hypothetical protein